MPHWGPISRRELIRALRAVGFAGGKHQFMVQSDIVLTIPNPHGGDIGVGLLARVLRHAGVSRVEWERI